MESGLIQLFSLLFTLTGPQVYALWITPFINVMFEYNITNLLSKLISGLTCWDASTFSLYSETVEFRYSEWTQILTQLTAFSTNDFLVIKRNFIGPCG